MSTTVAELIERLRLLPPDAPIQLVDADTGGYMDIIRLALGSHTLAGSEPPNPGTVYIWSEYGD